MITFDVIQCAIFAKERIKHDVVTTVEICIMNCVYQNTTRNKLQLRRMVTHSSVTAATKKNSGHEIKQLKKMTTIMNNINKLK